MARLDFVAAWARLIRKVYLIRSEQPERGEGLAAH
jgi:hypothetical protein